MYALTISLTDILVSLNNNHKITNKNIIEKAYEYAQEKHKGQNRKTGEPYIFHPLRVAKFIADWGFESNVVAAALLHDIVEDCNTPITDIKELFGSHIAKIVDTLSAVNKEMHIAQGLTKQEIDNLSDAKLLRNISDKALFIKIADRLDNLYTINGVEEAKQIKKVIHTREILIPLVKCEGAYQLVDQLEELCFQIEHKERYHEIVSRYEKIRKANSITTQKIITMFKELFLRKSSLVSAELTPYQDCILDFVCNPRSTISIFRQLSSTVKNMNEDLPKFISKNNIALYDFTLIFANNTFSSLDIFYAFYQQVLADKGICILDYCTTTYGDSKYLLLCDQMDNYYRFFLKTEKEYRKYKLGNIVDTDVSLSFKDVNDISPRDTYKKKIKVFGKDGLEFYIDKGATVLDFAFAIHGELGLHFDYATIDNSKTHLPPYRKLEAGDMITIKPAKEITATLQWFSYVNTSKATHHLIKHFQQFT